MGRKPSTRRCALQSCFVDPCRGQAMSEFVVVLPIMMLLALGAIQFGLLYEAKATLNLAAFDAARAGALNQGRMSAMVSGFANGLRPLLSRGTSSRDVIDGLSRAKDDATNYTRIDVVNPTDEAMKFWPKGIPNDNLSYSTERTPSGLTLQDANLLKIKVTYCARLIVPFINRTIITLIADGATDFEKKCQREQRLPIRAQAIVRMQTAYCPSCQERKN